MKKIFGVLIGLITSAVLAQGVTSPPNLRQQFRQLPQIHGGSRLQPSFAADFTQGSITARGATPTFTRATTATVTDQDNIVRNVLSGEARFQGLRRIQNGLVSPNEDFTTWSKLVGGTGVLPVVTSGFTAPDGTTTAYRVQLAGGGTVGNYSAVRRANTFAASATVRLRHSCWIKSNTGSNQTVSFSLGAGGGVLANIVATTTWQRITAPDVSGISNFMDIGVGDGNPTDATADVLVWHPQQENITGQAVQTPGEYLSVGVLSAPYHGANVDGVRYFPTHNGNVIQQNLLLRSQELDNAAWTTARASVVANVAIAPDGTLTAERFVEDATPASSHILITSNWTTATGQYYTLSTYLKAATRSKALISVSSGHITGGASVTCDMSAGTASPFNATGTITPVGNGWYRCSLTFLADKTNTFPAFINGTDNAGIAAYDGNGVSGFYVWGAQMQPGRRAGTYTLTTSAAVNNNIVEEATGDTIPATTRLGYLAEGQRGNLFLRSDNFSGTWVLTDVTNNPDYSGAGLSPDGSLDSDRIDEGVAGTSQVAQTVTATSNGNYVVSGFFKKFATNDWIQLGGFNGANSFRGWFNLTTGAKGSTGVGGTGGIIGSSIISMGNGWYRCIVIGSVGSAATAITGFFTSTSADNVTTRVNNAQYLAYGLQFEDNVNFVSSYIPTTTVAVLRNADSLTYPTTGWLSTTQGTMVVQLTSTDVTTNHYGWAISDTTLNNRVTIFHGGNFAYRVVGGGVATVSGAGTGVPSISTGVLNKAAFAYTTNDAVAYVNGVQDLTDNTVTVPSGLTTAYVGVSETGSAVELYGSTASVQYYPRRLTNSQLQSLTQ